MRKKATPDDPYPHLPEGFDPDSVDFPVYENAVLAYVHPDSKVLIQGVEGGRDLWEVHFLSGPFEGERVEIPLSRTRFRRPREIAHSVYRDLSQQRSVDTVEPVSPTRKSHRSKRTGMEGEDEMTTLTELDAAIAYARAWNRLDCSEFIDLLAPDAAYASQWVFEELKGRDAIAEYLEGKMESVENAGATVYAELAKASKPNPGRDCVALAQRQKESVDAVVLFDVQDGVIKRFDMCIPGLYNAVRSGEYPS